MGSAEGLRRRYKTSRSVKHKQRVEEKVSQQRQQFALTLNLEIQGMVKNTAQVWIAS